MQPLCPLWDNTHLTEGAQFRRKFIIASVLPGSLVRHPRSVLPSESLGHSRNGKELYLHFLFFFRKQLLRVLACERKWDL